VHNIEDSYKFLVIANGSLWKVMNSEEVVRSVFRCYKTNDPDVAAKAVLSEAKYRLNKILLNAEYISCVIVFLN